jgi:serine/threonine protein kinase
MVQRLPDGTILRSRYRLNNIVGHGGMGNVYLAEDLRLPGRLCAIKEIKPDTDAAPEQLKQEQEQFLREASLLAQLDHPNLPKVSDFFAAAQRDYLVMDYVPGKDLKELVDDSRANGKLLDPETVLSWSVQILDALGYLHRQEPPILHRDVKPSNIKLTPDGRIKLVDFGLAKVLAGDDSSTITVIQGRGTAYYTPLEQYGAESEHTDARSDIYALGGTLYHLLAGHPPAEAKERFLDPSVLRPLGEANRNLDSAVVEAINWALEMHPDDRPESIAMFKQALLGNGRPEAEPVSRRSPTRLRDAIVGNSIIVLLVLGLFLLAIILTVI